MMVYFNQKPYSPSSKGDLEQWSRVLDFKRDFPKEGLWWPYNGRRDFERLFRSHLTQFLRRISSAEQGEGRAVSPPAGYDLLTFVRDNVALLVRHIAASELQRSAYARNAAHWLYSLYTALDRLGTSSARFVDTLEKTTRTKDLALLLSAHEALVEQFEEFAFAAHACARRIQIYDSTLCAAIIRIYDIKSGRLNAWLGVFRAAGEQLRAKGRLARLAAILKKMETHWHLLDVGPLVFDDSISLDDVESLQRVVDDANQCTAQIRATMNSLGDFIKEQCDFVDLFPDDASMDELLAWRSR